MAAYHKPGRQFTFYEIDPVVAAIAMDKRYFTYLSDCAADSCEVVLGDGRLRLAEAEGSGTYDLLILDAFSSDAIPVHLLTREAFQLYLGRLRPGGVIALHISNKFLDLARVVNGVSADAGLVCLVRSDFKKRNDWIEQGKSGSTYAVVGRGAAELAPLRKRGEWKSLALDRGTTVWTDDHSNILSVIRTPR